MSVPFDAEQLARYVLEATGLPLEPKQPSGDCVLRLAGHRGRGFTITVRTRLNAVEAEWRPEGFATTLINGMRSTVIDRADEITAITGKKAAEGWIIRLSGFEPIGQSGSSQEPQIIVRSTPAMELPLQEAANGATYTATLIFLALMPDDMIEMYDSPGEEVGQYEGGRQEIRLSRPERDPRNRALCIEIQGTRCAACGLEMGEQYGPVAQGFIHIHHIEPLSQLSEERRINPQTDLVPLCPNCHAVAHLSKPVPLSVEEIRKLLSAMASSTMEDIISQ